MVLEENGISNFYFTLDGNEQFERADEFKTLWIGITSDDSLKSFMEHLLYVEQPLKRDAALCTENQEPLRRWKDRPPMIIDESDSQLDSLKIALDCGYNGTSHKNCKGVFKSIANACLLEHRRRANPQIAFILSAEDLVNVGPVALLQDLSMVGLLGIAHAERNGHHYFPGLSMFSPDLQSKIAAQHPDLYQFHQGGFVTMDIKNGRISLKSMNAAPFGVGLEIDPCQFTPLEHWRFETLTQQKVKKDIIHSIQ
jgi:hypothetical protein